MSSKSTKTEVELAEQYRQNGNICFGNGQFEDALELYTKSLGHRPTAVTYANRAQVHIELNSPEDAIYDARAALALDPNYLKARFRLGRALMIKKEFVEALVQLEKCRESEPENTQIRKAIEQCKKNSSNICVSGTASSSSLSDGFVPKFSFTEITISGCDMKYGDNYNIVKKETHKFYLETLDGTKFKFQNLASLRERLARENTNPIGPIGRIVLHECEMDQQLYQFFRSLNPKLLEGCELGLCGLGSGSDHLYAELLKLFRPISIHVASYENFTFDFSIALRHLPAFHSVKSLSFSPCFVPGDQKKKLHDGNIICAKLKTSDVLAWLHSPSGFPPYKSTATNPLELPGEANLMSELASANKSDATKIWRSPTQRMLQFHQEGLDKNLDEFINECNKLFQRTSMQFNYTIKVFFKINGPTAPICGPYFEPERIRPRLFTNSLGEHLRISVQYLTRDIDHDVHYPLLHFPYHDLVVIERFHRCS